MQATAIAPSQQLIDGDPRIFREQFNRNPFPVRHQLASHPLFELPNLMEFARRVAVASPGDIHYDTGDVGINQRWSEAARGGLPVDEAIRRIQDEQAWIFFKWAEKDPDYSALLDQCLAQIQERSGVDLKRVMKVREAIIFITSPNRITTYHIDRECNFLLQIAGSKTISIFDREDRNVLTEEEIERFWSVDNNAARYKEQYQDRAQSVSSPARRGRAHPRELSALAKERQQRLHLAQCELPIPRLGARQPVSRELCSAQARYSSGPAWGIRVARRR